MKSTYLNRLLTSIILMMMFVVSVQAQITEKAGFGKYALVGGTIHTVTQGIIETGVVLINGHRIVHVSNEITIPDGYERIDVSGKHIYPGFIDSGTRLGLIEISAVPVTVDDAEVGTFNPNMRAFTAINPNSVSIPVTRVSGVTSVIAHPSSGVISGKATLIDLFGYSPDSMAVKADAGLYIEWPTSGRRGWWDQRSEQDRIKEYEKNLRELYDFFDAAKAYHRMWELWSASQVGKLQPNRNQLLNAMRPVISGELPVIINVDREQDIRNVLDWVANYETIDVILSSVAEGWRVASEIAESGIPVLAGPVLRTPTRGYDNYQRPYQNAGLMAKAGVKVAIRTGETENVRNLPYHAGYAAVYGMGKEEALRAVTITPAQIFGVDNEIGSIEVGKRANLFVCDGDPFEVLTNISYVFINGYNVPMVSRQTQLYQQFIDRNP